MKDIIYLLLDILQCNIIKKDFLQGIYSNIKKTNLKRVISNSRVAMVC